MFENSKEHNQSWTVQQARKTLLVVLLASALFLIFRSLFLSPKAPDRPYLISKTSEKAILKSLSWYSHNSIGSLKIEDNRCIIEATDRRIVCKNSLEIKKSTPHFPAISTLKEDKTNWPFLWVTKAYDKEVIAEFALFEVEPTKIISQKERLTVLGTELVVEVEFQKVALSNVSRQILDSAEIKNLDAEKNGTIVASIALLPNPYGYYLPIYPLP